MSEMSRIRPHMEVIGADGVIIGEVDRVEGDRIKLARDASPDHVHVFLRVEDVAHTDEHVHLRQSSDELFRGGAAAGQAMAPGRVAEPGPADGAHPARHEGILPPIANPAVSGSRPRRNYYLPWVLVGLLLLALLWALVGRERDEVRAPADTAAGRERLLFGGELVTLPNGERVQLKSGTLNYDVQRYLASTEVAPRSFTFDRLNFATGSAAIRAEDRPSIDELAQLLAAYPAARVEVVGYADARGSETLNAQLGQRRAEAVAGALMALGVDSGRLSATSGGEGAPIDTNATAAGRFENRRTELVVAK